MTTVAVVTSLSLFSRPTRLPREITPLDKWEILAEQIEYKEELGRGAFGVVYKGTLQKRAGIEIFDTGKEPDEKKECQVVAIKVLQGICKFICTRTQSLKRKENFGQKFCQNITHLVVCCNALCVLFCTEKNCYTFREIINCEKIGFL